MDCTDRTETSAGPPSSGRGRIRPIYLALVAFVVAMLFQGSRGIWEPDEGRYSAVAMHMLRTGNFFVPALNDESEHFTKPPLTYWAIAAGTKILGRNEWGIRLPYALAFAGTVLILCGIARQVTPSHPFTAPVIYATCAFPFACANIVTTDVILVLWEALAVLGFVRHWDNRDRSDLRGPLIMMWTAFGLAFFTKGPPGLLPLLAMLFFAAIAGGRRSVLALFRSSGLVHFLLIGFGWFVAVVAVHPSLLSYLVEDEVVKRVATAKFDRNPQWYGPFRAYFPVLVLGCLPWLPILLRPLAAARRTLLAPSWWREKIARDQWPVFLVLWFLLPLAILSLSRSRLPLYVAPLFLPLALVIARLRPSFFSSRTVRCFTVVWVLLMVTMKGIVAHLPYKRDCRPGAERLSRVVSPRPDEVVFVGTGPYWGLSVYLDCEVEQVTVSQTNENELVPPETIIEELNDAEPRSLFVIARQAESSAMSALTRWRGKTPQTVRTRYGLLVAPFEDLQFRDDQAAEINHGTNTASDVNGPLTHTF